MQPPISLDVPECLMIQSILWVLGFALAICENVWHTEYYEI